MTDRTKDTESPAKTSLATRVRSIEGTLIDVSHRIHANPELCFEEVKASRWLCQELSDLGMELELGVGGLPTAFVATYGTGPVTVGICAEYDALPGVGHACGHNIIAASALGAGVALKGLADDIGATVKVIGTPAEEGGGGKILLMDAGVFDDIDLAMMVHPGPTEQVQLACLAVSHFKVSFEGKAAHASGFPHEGINALDAHTISQVAIGLLRQQLPTTTRVHGIVRQGGTAANIIPDFCQAEYFVRTPTLEELGQIEPRVVRCFQAGALASGASYSMDYLGPNYSEFREDPVFQDLYRRNAEGLGRSFPDVVSTPMSTDMANISKVIPSIHPMISLDCLPIVNHQAEFADVAISLAGDRAVIDGAIALAWTAYDLCVNPDARSQLMPRL